MRSIKPLLPVLALASAPAAADMSNPKFAEALITLTDPKVLAAAVSAASVLGGAVAGAPAR